MKLLLIIYCGVWLGFIITAFIYSTRFSLLDETKSNQSSFSIETLTQSSRNTKNNNCFETVIQCPSIGKCNCQTLCGNRFKEVIVEDDSDIIYLDQKLESGKYCLPNHTIPCPRQYGYTVFDPNGKSTCICKYPTIFGGKFCNEKQVCLNGVLMNRFGLPINELDFKDDDYYCKCFKDKNGNMMKQLPGDRLNCVSDPCLSLMVTARDNIGLTPEGECDCGDPNNTRVSNLYPNNLTSPCTTCFVQWMAKDHVTVPLRCLSTKGVEGYASPCRDFNKHLFQCDRLIPMRIEVLRI